MLGFLQSTSSNYYKLRQVCYKLREVVITNYGRIITNHDKIYYILRQLKYFIINYDSFWSYYTLSQNVSTNYDRHYKLRRNTCCFFVSIAVSNNTTRHERSKHAYL